MTRIDPKDVFYIKLGRGGEYADECIKEGIVKVGFGNVPLRAIEEENWGEILNIFSVTPTSFTEQIKKFALADERTLWITFHSDKLWWCFAKKLITENLDKTKYKNTVSGWSSKNVKGEELLSGNLSGALTAIQRFQGTICGVREASYVVKKINAEELPEVGTAEKDFSQLAKSVGALIKRLGPKDFELLIDLIFRGMGCQRIGVVGGVQKTKDIELFSPVIGERYLVQVKSRTNLKQYQEYLERFSELTNYSRYYYVYHTATDKKLEAYQGNEEDASIIWRLSDIAKYTIDAGLLPWLINKVG